MARKEILDRIEKYVDPFRIAKGKGKFPRRKFLHFATVAAAFPSLVGNASASGYPVRPVHIVVPSLPVGRGGLIAAKNGGPHFYSTLEQAGRDHKHKRSLEALTATQWACIRIRASSKRNSCATPNPTTPPHIMQIAPP